MRGDIRFPAAFDPLQRNQGVIERKFLDVAVGEDHDHDLVERSEPGWAMKVALQARCGRVSVEGDRKLDASRLKWWLRQMGLGTGSLGGLYEIPGATKMDGVRWHGEKLRKMG
ncbi:MAG: hypothetical protein EHM42_02975 [Planctomycetaceae bacterium]|nr:MAG: hypothetical protein EHM42_02975 [Planctomycetaceae bacterium]